MSDTSIVNFLRNYKVSEKAAGDEKPTVNTNARECASCHDTSNYRDTKPAPQLTQDIQQAHKFKQANAAECANCHTN